MPDKKKPETKTVLPDAAREVDAAGKTWQIGPEAIGDFEILDDLARWDDGDISRMPVIVRRLLGEEQYRSAMDVLRDKTSGRVPTEVGAQFLQDLLAGLNPN